MLLKWMYLFFLSTTTLFVAGCSAPPEQVGYSPEQWSALGGAQRGRITRGYATVRLANLGNNVKLSRGSSAGGKGIAVKIDGGTVVMPPAFKPQPYLPVSFALLPGQCESVWVVRANSGGKVSVDACYRHNELTLDPSRYEMSKRHASARFRYTPLWERGQTYKGISTSGYARFRGATLTIKRLSEPDLGL